MTELELDAFNSRIWGGLHFRDAMEDGYRIGHVAARRAMSRIDRLVDPDRFAGATRPTT